jgi:hypothetical protein
MTSALALALLSTLDRLAVLEGLSTQQIAARCILSGRVPAQPAFSVEVVTAYAKLEADQVRGTPAWAVQDALEGRR